MQSAACFLGSKLGGVGSWRAFLGTGGPWGVNSEDPGGPDFPGFAFSDLGFLDSWTSQGVQIFQDFHSWILDSWISVSRLNFPIPTLIGFALDGQKLRN